MAFEESMRVGAVRDDYKKSLLLNPAMEDNGLKKALLLQSERVETRMSAMNRLMAMRQKNQVML